MKLEIDKVIITVMSGADDGKKFEFEKNPIMIGRHATDDVYLPYDSRVSRNHARISKEGNNYYIEDVGPEWKGSKTGTFVNEQKIKEKTLITSGQLFLVGSIWVKFEAIPIN